MSRILKVMVVLLAITALVAPSVFAEDRLSLNGQLRIRGWYKDNNKDFNDNAGTTDSYIDQRLRLGGTLAVAEGVAVKFRYDLWDSTWGDNTIFTGTTTKNTNSNGLNDADNQAYIVITKDMFTLTAGDTSHALGNAIAIDTIGTGAILDINAGAATVQLTGFKMDEGNKGTDDDTDLYTLALMHKTDMYDGTVFAAYARDGARAPGNDDAAEIYLYGAQATFNLDAAKLNVEINAFDGDDGLAVGATDLKGLQAYVDASMAVSETATAGAILTYAKGYNGANEAQVTDLTDDASFLPETYGFMQIMYSIYPGSTFDPSGNGMGVMGLQGYARLKLSDALSVTGSVAYATTDEDYTAAYKAANSDCWEDFVTYVGSLRYAVAANTNLDAVLSYTTVDAADADTPDDSQMVAGFRLAVNF